MTDGPEFTPPSFERVERDALGHILPVDPSAVSIDPTSDGYGAFRPDWTTHIAGLKRLLQGAYNTPDMDDAIIDDLEEQIRLAELQNPEITPDTEQ